MAEVYELDGTVERIVYQNENNQYTVFEINDGQELYTVVGTFPYLSMGEEIKVVGEWTNHSTFGTQFKASTFERVRPKTISAVLKYLSGGVIKGIGPAMATKIVDTFGEDTIKVIESEPERLAQIKGISKNKALQISEEFNKLYSIRELMQYLGAYGIKPEEAVRVWKIYGSNAIEMIKENPYILCQEYVGIDFSIADDIAYSLEKPSDDKGRVMAGIIYILKHNANNGHSCLPMEKLIQTSCKMLESKTEFIRDMISLMCESGDLFCLLLEDCQLIFLPRFYNCETYIADRINMMLRYPPRAIVGIEYEIDQIQKISGVEYEEKQKDAIRAALDKGLLILTGGPGTGKTTTLNAIIKILKMSGERVFLGAPTGRAAKRMSEVTGEEAKTIHRMLQVDWDENDNPIFIKNEGNPLECDAVILDELSMVDSYVMDGVLRALPLGCRLILVGDSDQLPSVGAGNILGDLIASKKIPTIALTEIFRQSGQSLIVTNAHKIVKGELPILNKTDSDFFYLQSNEDEKIINTILDLYDTRLPKSYGYTPIEDIQILCPGRKGVVGTENLNKIIRERVNPEDPQKKQVNISGVIFREGDKVMQVKNDYNLVWYKEDGSSGEGVFNGDMGVITEVDKPSGIIRVKIDDKEAVYEFEKAFFDLELSYAVTIHKSQGNEFNAVIIPTYKGTPKLKYRNLLYTGITRAKKILILIGQRESINQMVNNDKKTLRYTGLVKFLENYE